MAGIASFSLSFFVPSPIAAGRKLNPLRVETRVQHGTKLWQFEPMSAALERLPMTMGYYRLIDRCFDGAGERGFRRDTNVSERDLQDSALEISLFQQVRQIENVTARLGPGWVFSRPEIWNATAHGAVAVAVISAPTIADGIAVLLKYGHVRAPFFRPKIQQNEHSIALEFEVAVALTEAQWRPMMEVAFLAVRSMIQASIGREPVEMRFCFAAPEPGYHSRVREALGESIQYEQSTSQIIIPRSWCRIQSIATDSILHRNAIGELQAALARLNDPFYLRARVERLLQTMPEGRLSATDVARRLGISRRTLARRLKDADAQFRELLEIEMKRRAVGLKVAKMRRDDMAERLGYRDPSSFSRAWRRWSRKSGPEL